MLYSYCPECGNHNLGINIKYGVFEVLNFYCPICDWKSENLKNKLKNKTNSKFTYNDNV